VRDDALPPKTICNQCYAFLDVIYNFRLQCHKVDGILRKQCSLHTKDDVREAEIKYEWPMSFFVAHKIKQKVDRSKLATAHRGKTRRVKKPNRKRNIIKLDSDIKFFCDICGKEFAVKNKLRKHLTIHTDIKVECTECGKEFPNKFKLRFHIRTVHEKTIQASCEYCGKVFTNNPNCKKHIAAIHKRSNTVECHICGTKLSNKNSLKVHKFIQKCSINNQIYFSRICLRMKEEAFSNVISAGRGSRVNWR
jgi:DNA-directed RNA polymerase subunit RPC12/RpoP